MGKIYKTQRIEIVLSYDAAFAPPAGVVDFSIKYRKPSGITGLYHPAIFDTNARTISYIGANSSKYGEAGKWTLWAVANMGGTDSPYEGEPVTVEIHNPGS
jgi:hypothetical protein